jgi:hypothetical protein
LAESESWCRREPTDEERWTLKAWALLQKTARALGVRSRIVPACGVGGTIGKVAGQLGVPRDIVSGGAACSCEDRLEELADESDE